MKKSKLTVLDAIRCGYMSRSAWNRTREVPEKTVRMLAAMALTCVESGWSDRLRDLVRGIETILPRQEGGA